MTNKDPAGAADAPVILRLEADPRDPDRVVVTVGPADGDLNAARTLLLHIAVVAEAGLHIGQPCPPERLARLDAENTFQQFYARALNFLAVRPRSEAEVRQRLRQKGTPPAVVDGIIARLQRAGYLDDAAFARYWIGERARSSPRGARLLRAELRGKGVASAVVEAALEGFAEETAAEAPPLPASLRPAGADPEVEAPDDTEVVSREVRDARALAARKMRSYAGLPEPTVRRRLSGFLLRRGYDYGTVARALKAVLADEDSENMV